MSKRNGRKSAQPETSSYDGFIESKSQIGENSGFEPIWMPDQLYPFQASLCDWSIRKGRAAIFATCGLGKSAMQLTWADNVVRKTNGRVLILTPLAVASQTAREGVKFGIEATVCRDGKLPASKIVITNYERLHYFNPDDFEGAICDESGCLKSADSKIRGNVTEFMRKLKYRLLCTAVAAPNDYPELGNSSEALGGIGYMDMLGKFFKNDQNSNNPIQRRWNSNPFGSKFRFRGHAEHDFWRWVCSWARAVRKPSDLGFDDGPFTLPPLTITDHLVKTAQLAPGFLFALPASNLREQRDERRRSLRERCEQAAAMVDAADGQSISWCNLNDEGDLLEEMIPESKQITGAENAKQSDEEKEEILRAFVDGEIPALVGKASSLGFGLNLQNCAHQTYFVDDSFERFFQAVRRSWRFGQKNPVLVDVISSEGQSKVLANLQRKAKASDLLFEKLVLLMQSELKLQPKHQFANQAEIPSWL